jgi:hypothetical protein
MLSNFFHGAFQSKFTNKSWRKNHRKEIGIWATEMGLARLVQ